MNPAGSQERTESSAAEGGARIERYADRSGDHSLGRALGYFILPLSLGVHLNLTFSQLKHELCRWPCLVFRS